jgi:hypothetical protein
VSRLGALGAAALLAGCGVKAPPRPPGVERAEPAPAPIPPASPASAPDPTSPPNPITAPTSTTAPTDGAPGAQPCP